MIPISPIKANIPNLYTSVNSDKNVFHLGILDKGCYLRDWYAPNVVASDKIQRCIDALLLRVKRERYPR